MRILHLAWEYPPVMFGGLGRHVHALATAQAAQGHDVTVITQAPSSAAPARVPWTPNGDGVHVVRAMVDPMAQEDSDLLGRIAGLERAFTSCGTDLIAGWEPDVIHAHDWMVTQTALELRQLSGAPLAATIHATEAGRNRGWISNDLSTAIHGAEWQLANTCDALITCSQTMRDEVGTLFGQPDAHVVVNGIHPEDWVRPAVVSRLVDDAITDADPLIVCTGRMEWEKGVQTIISAMPALRASHPRIRLVVAGRGSYLDDLQQQADRLGLEGCVRFLGWVDEADLRSVVGEADLAIAPSLYEPFGLVALEAAAIGTPLLVARTGGLAEFAVDERTALTFTPGDAASLTQSVRRALADPERTRRRAEAATSAILTSHSWADVARQTISVYEQARSSLGALPDEPGHQAAPARRTVVAPPFTTPPGRLLDVGR